MSDAETLDVSTPKTVSVIVPCYNERQGIPHLHEQLREVWPSLRERYRLELVFVDDGSTDGTADMLTERFADFENCRVVRHPRNLNLGAAIRTGFGAATGDYLVTIDADCTTPMAVIPLLLARVAQGVDVATASPYHPAGGLEGVSLYRQALSRGLAGFLKLLLGAPNYTYTVMVRAYRREVIETIGVKYDNFVAMTQLLCHSILAGFRVEDQPAVLTVRRFGASKMQTYRTIVAQLGFIATLLGPVFRKRVLRRPARYGARPGKTGRSEAVGDDE
jgi:dolichol-phosphate mannosyltransferase